MVKSMSLQLLHCSDLHLDKNFNIPNLTRALQRKEDLSSNFSSVVEYAIKNKPDLFIMSGDIFDKILPTNASRVFLTQEVKRLRDAKIAVFMIGGNHEVPRFGTSPSLAIDVLGSAGIATVFSHSDTVEKRILSIGGKSICISGRSYYTQFEGTNPLKDVEIPCDGDYNILMIHGSLQGLNVASSNPEMAHQNPFLADDIKKGLNYLALGHFHNHFEREYMDCTIANPGSLEKLSWAEMNDEKGFVWTELNGSETSTKFVKLHTRPMETSELTLSKDEAYSPNIKDHFLDFLSKLTDKEKMLKINLRGMLSQEQYGQLKINEILNACKDLFFHLIIDRKELEVEGYGRIFLERIDNPVEAFSKRLDSLITQSGLNDANRQLLEQVKSLGMKYLESVK
jgi:DNA repair exonuclease SbcCD nuclease subunit